MASSSSTSDAAAAAATTYQVFLSFRGPDTRQGFTDVLYHALVKAGVRVFRDDEEIRKGEEIGEEIPRAIEESRIFVPIFSKGYASSKWCLIELTKMLELKEGSSGKKIIPIFYNVGVNDVKLRTDMYTEALKEQKEKHGAERVKKWEEALRQAGKFKGWELKDQGFVEFIESVVKDISRTLKVKHKCVSEYFVPRDDPVKALVKLLDTESTDVRFVGIHGMGGIGKTTLAKTVFNKICDSFDCSSFLNDVRESSLQHKGIEHLQKQLLRDLGLERGEIRDVDDGIKKIREKLVEKKVLIVLDDVNHLKQIRSLAGDPSWFCSRSRIIVTTRDQRVLEKEPLRNQTFEVGVMKPEEARQLFCKHAFREEAPPGDYLSLLEDAIASTGLLPLALEVIGSHLRDKSYKEWVAIIKKLQEVPHEDVQEKLMISYEALSHGTKQIFLDIACFFIGEEKTYPIYMWQACDFDPKVGLKDLVYMSLVKVTKEKDEDGLIRKRLRMHDQLRDLGRKIANPKSSEDGVKLSRPWLREDASKILREKEHRKQVEMVRFPEYRGYTFSQKEISSLRKLRYLECYRADFSGELTDMLPKLRWLCWYYAPQEIKGTGIFFRNLVILNLSDSDIDENWSGWVQVGVGSTLKVLNLSSCGRLTRTPDLSSYSSLEMLILRRCSNLIKIDPSIGKLKGLKHLDVLGCDSLEGFPEELCSLYNLEVILASSKLKQGFHLPEMIGDLTSLLIFKVPTVKLPRSVGKLARLRHLSLFVSYGPMTLSHTESLVEPELPDTIGQLVKLEVLSLSGPGLTKLPGTIGNMTSLVELHLSCSRITELPDSIGNMRSLVKLNLSYSGITELPDSIGNLENLRVIDMEDSDIERLPSSFGMLKRLEELDASETQLEEIPSTFEGLTCLRVLKLIDVDLRLLPPKLPTGLTDVEISSSKILERVPEFSNLQALVRLVLRDCCYRSSEVGPIKLEGIGKLRRLVKLTLSLWNVTCIPEDEEFSSLPQLQKLSLRCPNLHYCPPLPSTLLHLTLCRCGKMTELPRLSNLKNLSTLELAECCISDDTVGNLAIGELESLTTLSLKWCKLGNLRNGLHLPANLQRLSTIACESLEGLLALSHELKNLKELHIWNAEKLVEIPELGELESLQELAIEYCGFFEGLPNLSKLKSLRRITIYSCKKFKGIDGIDEMKLLEYLSIKYCDCEDVYITLPRKSQEKSRKRPLGDLYRDD